MFETSLSILQEVELQSLTNRSVKLFVKRDDLIDILVSGNKWRKLKFNVEHAKVMKKEGVLTFGGAFSNHLIATAAACKKVGLKSLGIVRGQELNIESNDTLLQCSNLGMKLEFATRTQYAMRDERFYHEELNSMYKNYFIVPEGGSNYYGMIGCQEIIKETPNDFDHVFVAQGTTTTSCGIAMVLGKNTQLHVVPVLKGFDALSEMKKIFQKSGIEEGFTNEILSNINVLSDYHFGAYGQYTKELLDFMETFFEETGIPLDPIYTGKALYALFDWIEKENISNARILFVHTGGIQGGTFIAKKEGRTFS